MILVISDIHMYMYRRIGKLKPVQEQINIDDVHISATFEYLTQVIEESARENADLSIFYLGDIVDNAYIKECEFELFSRFLDTHPYKTSIIVGNHDTSSTLPENKIKYSPFKFIKNKNIHIITDYDIQIIDNTLIISLSFKQRKDIYGAIYNVFRDAALMINENIKHIVLLSHNNIYMTETLNESIMLPVASINELLNMVHIPKTISFTLVNGHVHQSHYEINPTITDRKFKYFQLGSVSPTSFKKHPIASGAVLLDTISGDHKIFDNKKLVLLSIDTVDLLDKLVEVLESGKQYKPSIFLKYPVEMKNKIAPIIKKYTEIKGYTHN